MSAHYNSSNFTNNKMLENMKKKKEKQQLEMWKENEKLTKRSKKRRGSQQVSHAVDRFRILKKEKV